MEITSQKHLLKKTFNKKAHGIIEVVAKSDTKDIICYTWIKGDYDTISGVKEAVERGLKEWGEGSQPNS